MEKCAQNREIDRVRNFTVRNDFGLKPKTRQRKPGAHENRTDKISLQGFAPKENAPEDSTGVVGERSDIGVTGRGVDRRAVIALRMNRTSWHLPSSDDRL